MVQELEPPDIAQAFVLGLATLARIVVLVAIASVIWVPIGVWVGTRPRVTRLVQPIALEQLAGIGGWQIGPRQTIFTERRTGTRFCALICYESVYPGFVASFVRSGAEFISIITIDSWWAKMSGAYQHHQFAIFRAVENRRWGTKRIRGELLKLGDDVDRSTVRNVMRRHRLRSIVHG